MGMAWFNRGVSTIRRRVWVRDRHHTIPNQSLWQRGLNQFWMVPSLIILAALGLGVLLPILDAALGGSVPLAFPGGPDGARGLLGTIAGAMISVTGLVFSITIVVLQLASNQFTPRILKRFLATHSGQYTLGIFLATFLYALTVLRDVRGGGDGQPAFVPQLSVSVSFLLVLGSVVAFIFYIQEVTSMIQVSEVISLLGDRTAHFVEDVFPRADASRGIGEWETDGDPVIVALNDRNGHIVEIDERGLVALAQRLDLRVEIVPEIGQFITPGQPLAKVWGADADSLDEMQSLVNREIQLGADRSMTQDPLFGIRQLVDIAERALSPAINDPTTAVQVLNEIERITRLAVSRLDPAGYLTDSDGVVRVLRAPADVKQLLRLSMEEIARYGRDDIQVPRRIRALLSGLEDTALPEHRDALAEVRAVIEHTLTPGSPTD